MLVDITDNARKIREEIADLVGKGFPLLERIKMGGIGSQKLLVVEASREIKTLLDRTTNTSYCNIELRSGGILVGFQSGYRDFVWVIPFPLLSIFHDGKMISIHSSSKVMKMIGAYNDSISIPFLKKLLSLKAAYAKDRSIH